MTFARPAPVAQAFERARTSEAPLNERLRIVADVVADHFPAFTRTVDDFVARLEQARAGASAPEVGSPMPDFALPDQNGHLVRLTELLNESPIVVAFHRGHWCPYCHLNVIALREIEEKAQPARIIAISPETQRYTRALKEETGAGFPFLTDVGAAYALSLNLAVWIDDQFARLIAESGCDVPLYNGMSEWILPIPAVFILKEDGTIAARHIDPDFRRRMEVEELLGCVQRLF